MKSRILKRFVFTLALPVIYLFAFLPFPVLYLLSNFLKVIVFDIIGYRKQVIFTNLRKSFPTKSEDEILLIAKQFYQNFCDLLVEAIKLSVISEKELVKRIKLIGYDKVEAFHQQGRSSIISVSHCGNWEYGPLIQGHVSSVPSMIVYKTIKNQPVDAFVKGIRSRFGSILVPKENTLRKIAELKGKPWLLVLAGDQKPGGKNSPFWTYFLNQETNVFLGVEKIAKSTNSVVFYCDIRRLNRGYYEAEYSLLTDSPKEMEELAITKMHLNALEEAIKKNPSNWLWSHRRWKSKRPQNITIDTLIPEFAS
ncbi:lysophospholipid acyltransferase family protein [Solitalea agri]|uniref:lysophospholipid acyltransferase family protein n=1 Tax=Solitalea TaxID=929509 RepID=UPI00313441C9